MRGLFSNGVKAVALELLPGFERAGGSKADILWASTNMLLDEIAKGTTGDLTILTEEAIDDLIRQGKVKAGSRVDLARSKIGIAVRKGAPRPDIGTAEAFKTALLAAKGICYSKTGISGVYFPTVLDRLGIAAQMKPKTSIPEPGVLVGTLVADGRAEIGVQQISELLPVPGIEVVGPLPDALQRVTTFSAGIFSGAKDADAAAALVKALTAPSARAVYAAKGMEAVG
jgi:molybdate transport system substrate-binding protein